MKNKISQISLISPIGLILLISLIIISFSAGFYLGKQKAQLSQSSQKSPITPTSPISPTIFNQKLTVIAVTDGDTLKLSNGRIFRLYGMSTPEFKQPYYKEANEFTKNMVLNKEVTFEQEEKYKEDKFGRMLGYVFIDGKNLNVELVRAGLAKVVLYEKRAKIKYQDELLQAEKEAREKRVGIWVR